MPRLNFDMEVDKELLKKAIELWGEKAQREMVIEEALELGLALMKLRRSGDPEKRMADVIDEVADMKIMVAQAELLFDLEAINTRVEFKMNRLKKKIESKEVFLGLNGWNARWNGLPEKDGAYLVIHNREVVIRIYNSYHKCWDQEDGDDHFCDLNQIDFWKEMPQMPQKA
jgi:hypothetical protein